ncbi:3-phenylpropionate/cinnamic acid dioxygenase subunit beta [Allokutzneria sp. A3M-2-11 16]|uniref:3-phenylpropionate/cinnamic acid dioxygenase subunit beta n=1 Tax=Allokutzneria sp. A3M-2-11 16 TaxID=2962043 RepID=UPI0020B8F32A|nr:3-phenylpropionate/cinnamic acid dioxygenase subunit beta [Allokutzneria sp. A3M-2-11 16]MCP3805015.1 3-phenylpropionate/cinnamic acid dioxygenase subunit beta [Allokutzneria sp. A3M-2-11 16]
MPFSQQAFRPRAADAAPVTPPTPVSPAEHHAIEQFLSFEAQLLDEARYDDWLDLLADDLHYFMPLRRNTLHRDLDRETTAPGELAHYDDTRAELAVRILRVQQPTAWSDNPPPRTVRLISNVQARAADKSGEYQVRSVFHLYRNRLQDDTDSFAGHRDDLLRRDGATGFRIVRRTVHIEQSVVLAKNLGVLF